jgi:hypothetical protein
VIGPPDGIRRQLTNNSFAGRGALCGRKRNFAMAAITKRPLTRLATTAEGNLGLAISALKPVTFGIENGNVSLDH